MGFLRKPASILLTIIGFATCGYSLAVAFGWDQGPFSKIGTVLAIIGLSVIFASYWIVRDMSFAHIPSDCLRFALGFGSTFVVVGLLSLIPHSPDFPTGYFLATGLLSLVGFLKFRNSINRK